MQTHGGTNAANAITAKERRFVVELKADWNRNGLYNHALSDLSRYVENIDTDRSLRGSLPQELLLVEGASAAQMGVELAGSYQNMSMAMVFSPFNGYSPFYNRDLAGVEMTYRLGVDTPLGLVWYSQFVGFLRTAEADRESGTVQIEALDRVEVLRQPIRMPYWAVMEPWPTQGSIESQLLESQWVIDHCLRFCNTSPSPYRPVTPAEMGVDGRADGMHFWLSANGGHTPTYGWYNNATVQTYPYVEAAIAYPMYSTTGQQHPGVVATDSAKRPLCYRAQEGNTGSIQRYWAQDRDAINTPATHWMGFTLVTEGLNANYYLTAPTHDAFYVRVGGTAVCRIKIGAGKIWTTFDQSSTGRSETSSQLTIPTTPGAYRVFCAWDFTGNTGTRCFMTILGGPATGWQTTGAPLSNVVNDTDKGLIHVEHRCSLQDIFYSARNVYGVSNAQVQETGKAAKYAAVLDRGMNRFSWLPPNPDQDAWDIISEVAAAEFGSVFWDEAGVFRFWNMSSILAKQSTVVRSFGLDQVSRIKATSANLDSVRNAYSVAATRKRSRFVGPIFSAGDKDEFYIPAGQRVLFRVWADDIVSPVTSPIVRQSSNAGNVYGIPVWSDTASSHAYVPQWFSGGVWQEFDNRSGVDITVYHAGDGAFLVNIWNGWGEPVRLARNTGTAGDGSAAFRFHGTRIDEGDVQVLVSEDRSSINTYGARNLSLSGDWYQEFNNNNSMITSILPRTTKSIPVTDAFDVPGDPRLQLGDTISVKDPDGMGEEIKLQIFGIRRRYSRTTGLQDTLTAEVIRSTVGIWDSPQYGRWDQTFIWSP